MSASQSGENQENKARKDATLRVENAIIILIEHLDFFKTLVQPESPVWSLKSSANPYTLTELFRLNNIKEESSRAIDSLLNFFRQAFQSGDGAQANSQNKLLNDFASVLNREDSLSTGKTQAMRDFLHAHEAVVKMILLINDHPARVFLEPKHAALIEYENRVKNEMSYHQLDVVQETPRREFLGYDVAPLGGNGDRIRENQLIPGKQPLTDIDSFATFYLKNFNNAQALSDWKVHISIKPSELDKAWQIVAPILFFYEVPVFKIVRLSIAQLKQDNLRLTDEETMEMLRLTKGMQLSIYLKKDNEKHYNEMFLDIEKALAKAHVAPGIIYESDKPIGIYTSVRHQGKNYVPGLAAKSYNPDKVDDPFTVISQEILRTTPKR